MMKKEIDVNNFNAQRIKTDPVKPKTDINHLDRKDNKPHVYGQAKQQNLRSAFDEGREYARPQPT